MTLPLRLARFAGRLILRILGAIVSPLLRFPFARNLLNRGVEEGPPPARKAINAIFEYASVRSDFLWRCRVGDSHYVMPVLASLPRSWNAARVWTWSGVSCYRAFYEFYVRRHPDGVFFDVGANDGTHTCFFAAHAYTCVAFEPQPTCIAYMEDVFRRNTFARPTIVPAALGAKDGVADFYISASTWFSSMQQERVERFEQSERISVPLKRLDDYCSAYGIMPTLIKIDVEGGELGVLMGANHVFDEARPDVVIEILDREHKAEIWSLLASRGYLVISMEAERHPRFQRIADLDAFLESPATDFAGLTNDRLLDEFMESR